MVWTSVNTIHWSLPKGDPTRWEGSMALKPFLQEVSSRRSGRMVPTAVCLSFSLPLSDSENVLNRTNRNQWIKRSGISPTALLLCRWQWHLQIPEDNSQNNPCHSQKNHRYLPSLLSWSLSPASNAEQLGLCSQTNTFRTAEHTLLGISQAQREEVNLTLLHLKTSRKYLEKVFSKLGWSIGPALDRSSTQATCLGSEGEVPPKIPQTQCVISWVLILPFPETCLFYCSSRINYINSIQYQQPEA